MTKYIVKVRNIDGENRDYEFDDEAKAMHEFFWYLTYSTAETVEVKAIKDDACDTSVCEDFDMSWVKGIPAYHKLYGYAGRYCELTECGDWELTDEERDRLTDKVEALMTATAETIAAYHDVNPDLLIDYAVEDWYQRHDIDSE